VSSSPDPVTRRSFLQAAAPFALGLTGIARGQTLIERGRFNEDDIPLAREQLLKMVNAERVHAGLNRLELDDLACKVATEHAGDMANGNFLSHWGADVYYEPLPSPPDINWLREPRSYAMPEVHERLFPRLPERYSYPDGSHGTIEIDSTGKFRVSVGLSKKPGINTIMIWLREGRNGTAFPASQICIRVE
jgi:hypothetical protein